MQIKIKTMQKLFVVFSFILSLSSLCKSQTRDLTKIKDYLILCQELDVFSGTILIGRNEEVILNESFGKADFAWDISNTQNTKFRIASLSKPFTKLAIKQLFEQGLLDYSDPISKYINNFPNGNKITLKHLLDGTSGIPHINDFENYDQFAKEHYSISEIIDIFKDKPLDFEPGTESAYSNSKYVILANIIENISKKSFGEHMQENIFKPSGMINTGHESSFEVVKNLAGGYMMNLSGPGVQRSLYYDISIKIGGGSLYSNVTDLFKFNLAYKRGKLSKNTEPLYNEGIFGRSPGYTAMMWSNDEYFVSILGNNYSTPIEKVAFDIVLYLIGKNDEFSSLMEYQKEYVVDNSLVGEYDFEGEIISIVGYPNNLVLVENNDTSRGERLLKLRDDHYFSAASFSELIFIRDEVNLITGIQLGDETGKRIR